MSKIISDAAAVARIGDNANLVYQPPRGLTLVYVVGQSDGLGGEGDSGGVLCLLLLGVGRWPTAQAQYGR
jgi:hypothetical protein